MERFFNNYYLLKFVICLSIGVYDSLVGSKYMIFWFALSFFYAILHLDLKITNKNK